MLNFLDFVKRVRKDYLSVYPDGLENVGFYFELDRSSGIDMVRVGVGFFDSSLNCLFSSNNLFSLVTFEKAWEIYTKSLEQC